MFYGESFFTQGESRNYEYVEYDDHYELRLFVPGFKKEDINIEENNGAIYIEGERKSDDKGKVLVNGGFKKVKEQFAFSNADVGEVKEAILENGILRLILEKKTVSRQIEIK